MVNIGAPHKAVTCSKCGSELTEVYDHFGWRFTCGACAGDGPAGRWWQGHGACDTCKRSFYSPSSSNGGRTYRQYCSGWCRDQPRYAPHKPRKCTPCGKSFTPKRSDAKYCSGKCRVAAHRAKAGQ